MRIALVVPGGVDRSGEYRVIPVLLALISRLARQNDVHVYALNQESEQSDWVLDAATIHNIGSRRSRVRAVRAICTAHRKLRFDLVQAIWSGACGMVAVLCGTGCGAACMRNAQLLDRSRKARPGAARLSRRAIHAVH